VTNLAKKPPSLGSPDNILLVFGINVTARPLDQMMLLAMLKSDMKHLPSNIYGI
jgi:hypothetical protein